MQQPQWRYCPTHLRLCEVGSPRDETPFERGWRYYQEAVRETVRERWEERQLLLRWLDYVGRTHRDTYTMETLERTIRVGSWGRGWAERARRLCETIDAETVA